MFRIDRNVITLTRGDTANFTLRIIGQDGNEYDYSEDTVLFTVKQSVYNPVPLIQKTVVYGEDIVLDHDDTMGLSYGDYWYDVEISNESGEVATIITPTRIRILSEVTF